MRTKKTKAPPRARKAGHSVNELSKFTGRDRRTIDKATFGLTPVRTVGRSKFYRLADIEKVLAAKGSKTLKDEKLEQEIRKLRIANDAKEKLVVLRSSIVGEFRKFAQVVCGLLDRKLENEYPSAVAGLDVPQARVFGKRLNDSIKVEIQKACEGMEKL